MDLRVIEGSRVDFELEDVAARTELERQLAEIWQVVQDEALYIPIHHQVLNWGMKSNVGTVVAPDDAAKFKYFTLN